MPRAKGTEREEAWYFTLTIVRSFGSGSMSTGMANCLSKPLRECRLIVFFCDIDRVLPVFGARIRIGAEVDQQLRHVDVAAARGRMKWGEAQLLSRVRIGAALEEQAHRRAVAHGRRRVNRRYTLWIFRRRVHVRSALDQRLRQIRMSNENRQAERGQTIFAVSVQQRRLALEGF